MKKKFSDHYLEYKARPGYERTLQHWITDYEGIKNDDEHVAQYLGDLSIDMQNDNTPELESFYIESEQFHTYFGQLKGSESITIVNTLAYNAFKHQIILSDKTVLPTTVPAPYVFNLSIDSWYNDMEFKGLPIDSRAST